MTKLCAQDERTLQQFRGYLSCFYEETTADEAATLLRTILEERNLNTLADLDGDTINKLKEVYRGDKKRAVLRYYGELLPSLADLHPDNEALIAQHFDGVLPVSLEVELLTKCVAYVNFETLMWETPIEDLPKCNVIFRLRKKKKTDWFEKALSFLEECTPDEFRGLLGDFKQAVDDILNGDNNRRIGVHKVRGLLSRLLYIAAFGTEPPVHEWDDEDEDDLSSIYEEWAEPVGLDEGGPAEVKTDPERERIQRKARRLLDDPHLEKDPLIEVLQGEYIDPDPGAEDGGTIILYLANILDFAKRHCLDKMACLQSAFFHQTCHFFYHSYRRRKGVDQGQLSPDAALAGRIVEESLASYFEWHVAYFAKDIMLMCTDPAPLRAVANCIERSWRDKPVQYYPWAGAKKLTSELGFFDVFREATSSAEGLFSVAVKLIE